MIETGVLQGQAVRLRPLEETDVPLLTRWYGNPDIRHWLHLSEDSDDMLTEDAHRERYERLRADPARALWRIDTLDGQPIGSLTLFDINRVHGRAELGVMIGEKDRWARGYGTDAIRLALRYAFDHLGLRKVYLITDEDNERGIRCYEKCGFVREGLLRAHRLRRARPVNMLTMGALREDFAALEGRG